MPKRAAEDALRVEIASLEDLRDWLAENHFTAASVWLVHHKKSEPAYVPMGEIVTELLCWGWVDSVSRAVDGRRTSHLISPRKPGSAWSAINKAKVAEARAAGRMTDAGEAAIAAAQANGMWTFLDDVERLEVPDDLAAALGATRATWDRAPPSRRRGTLEWLKTARTDATRAKRIAAIAEAVRAGGRPPPGPP